MYNWIQERIDSKKIDEIDNDLFIGKKVLIAPEGYGKSTKVIEYCLEKSQNNIIFSTHTIDNAKEKYDYIIKKYPDKNVYYLESDSELFRKMLRPQSKDLFNFMRKSSSKYCSKYIILSLYSLNGKLKSICRSRSQLLRLKGMLEYNKSSYNFNSNVLGDIYNHFNSVKCKNTRYYLLYKYSDDPYDYFEPIIDEDLEDILRLHNYNIVSLQEYFRKKDIGIICVTQESISNWRGFRKERDKIISKALTENNVVIISQNKVVENTLLPKIDSDKFSIIVDELTNDCFRFISNAEIKELISIIEKCSKYGIESLTKYDEFLLNEFDIKKKQLNKNTDIGDIKICTEGNLHISIGKPFISSRLNTLENTLVLTTEYLPTSILTKNFGFTCYELDSNLRYEDNLISIYQTTKHDPLLMIKSDKENVSKFVSLYKQMENNISETVCIGTSYFGTDFTIDSCKGRNFGNIRRIGIFKNPDSKDKTNIFLQFISKLENIEISKELRKHVSISHAIDYLNQTIGRVSGYRRIKHKDVKIDLFYHNRDSVISEALDYIRYTTINNHCSFSPFYKAMVDE